MRPEKDGFWHSVWFRGTSQHYGRIQLQTPEEKGLEAQRTDPAGCYIWSLSTFGDWGKGVRIVLDLRKVRANPLQLLILRPEL